MSQSDPLNAPETLYKYCSIERIDVLRDRRIRFTQRDELNDVYEMRPRIEFEEEAYRRARQTFAEKHPLILEVPETTADENEKLWDETIGMHVLILSLSSHWDIIPMWGYYANSHRGFVIGFDGNHEFLRNLRKVEYTDTYPSASADFGIYTKYTPWQHEKEWRAFNVLDAEPMPDFSWCDRFHLYRFPPIAVREIVLGNRMSECDKSLVLEVLKDRDYTHVRVYEAKPTKGTFALSRFETLRD